MVVLNSCTVMSPRPPQHTGKEAHGGAACAAVPHKKLFVESLLRWGGVWGLLGGETNGDEWHIGVPVLRRMGLHWGC